MSHPKVELHILDMGVITLVFSLILFKFMGATAGSAYRIGDAPLGATPLLP